MKEYKCLFVNCDEDSCDPTGNIRTEFPEIFIHFSNERHTDGLQKLQRFDIFADSPSVFLLESLEPIPDGFTPGIEFEEGDADRPVHGPTVPIMVRMFKVYFMS